MLRFKSLGHLEKPWRRQCRHGSLGLKAEGGVAWAGNRVGSIFRTATRSWAGAAIRLSACHRWWSFEVFRPTLDARFRQLSRRLDRNGGMNVEGHLSARGDRCTARTARRPRPPDVRTGPRTAIGGSAAGGAGAGSTNARVQLRFRRAHDEVRSFLRPATRRKQHVPAARRRAIHVQRIAALRDMIAVA